MGTNVMVSIPQNLETLAARNVGFTVEEFSDEFASMRRYGCWLVFDGVKVEASVLRKERSGTHLECLTFRHHSWPVAEALQKKLNEIYGTENIFWIWG